MARSLTAWGKASIVSADSLCKSRMLMADGMILGWSCNVSMAVGRKGRWPRG